MDNRQQKRVTLRHLASVCNLSVSTVSQILNNRDTYSTEKTKEVVRRTAHELGYRPNIGYKLMHGLSTKTAVIVLSYSDMMSSEYIQKITLSLIDHLNEKGYFTYIVKMPDEWPKRKQAIEQDGTGRGIHGRSLETLRMGRSGTDRTNDSCRRHGRQECRRQYRHSGY